MSFSTINPYNLQILKLYQYDSLQSAQVRIKDLFQIQKKWKKESIEFRINLLRELSKKLEKEKIKFATQASIEMGKPITQSIMEVDKCIKSIELIVLQATNYIKIKNISGHFKETILYPEPFGLILSIQPWNFPYWQVIRMAACALVAGNLVILKHSELVAGCAELLSQISYINNYQLISNLFLNHQDVSEIIKMKEISMITLTGSTNAGQQVGALAGMNLKKQILELGGSDAYIISDDSDLELATDLCVRSRLTNSGQSCIAGKRFFIHSNVYENFKTKFILKLKSAVMGDPLESTTTIGPLANQRFVIQLKLQIEKAKSNGAHFIEVQSSYSEAFSPVGILEFGESFSTFEEEEIFAPIAQFYKYSNIVDVISAINGGPYGLGGGIFTSNPKLAKEIAAQVMVGTFVVNSIVQSDARVPFGGTKMSGIGREMGTLGINEFINWKTIGID